MIPVVFRSQATVAVRPPVHRQAHSVRTDTFERRAHPAARFGIAQLSIGKPERLKMVFERLEYLPPAPNALMAFQQLVVTMKDIEDTYTAKSYDLTNRYLQTVRMYIPLPPEEEYHAFRDYPGVTYLPGKGHHIMIGRNGSIEIQTKDPKDPREVEDRRDAVIFSKEGANGLHLWDDPMNRQS